MLIGFTTTMEIAQDYYIVYCLGWVAVMGLHFCVWFLVALR